MGGLLVRGHGRRQERATREAGHGQGETVAELVRKITVIRYIFIYRVPHLRTQLSPIILE
eukprot:SAG31_NODE_33249_length_346_cov_0.619433_2_plen_59_part_01